MPVSIQRCEETLLLDHAPLVSHLAEGVTVEADPRGIGVFLKFTAAKPAARLVFPLGDLEGVRRFTCCHRYEPFWNTAAVGTRGGEVPVETQFLLTEREDGLCVAFIPLLDGPFRAALQGTGESGLELVAESGDPAVVTQEIVGLFVAADSDPYTLLPAVAQSVMARMQTGRLRRDKPLPDFIERFGWCTWDAFYQEVSHAKVREGLESFAKGGVTPKTLILDDGWQSVRDFPAGGRRLTAFEACEKFPGDLAATVSMAKEEFGVAEFLVWHAMTGYWGGVDGDALPGYGVRSTVRAFSPGILHHMPTLDSWWGGMVGVVSPEAIYRFFQDYHRHLRKQGVDGVKVDTQATLEGVAYGLGGRVELMRAYHEALEGSAQTHFRGNLINCMSCASEMFYSALNSTLTRTSTDFWPNRPASHGLHLYVNAQVSLWFGEFVHPDWDMFQSGHVMGAYHAAGRAVGGCPVYVSDKPGEHNFDLLRKLVLDDGAVLRAAEPGRPTRDCLFHDPTREDVLLKIFNRNRTAGVLGVFHARCNEEGTETAPISGAIRPSDVVGLEGERFAVYAHHARELRVLAREATWELTLAPLSCEVFTVVPITQGIAPVGLAKKFNSAGAILAQGFDAQNAYEITMRGSGRFLCWCEQSPAAITLDGEPIVFTYDPVTQGLEIDAPEAQEPAFRKVRMVWRTAASTAP